MMRGVGLILILISCSGLGIRMGGRYSRRIKECRRVEARFRQLGFAFRYGQLPMEEGLRQACQAGSGGTFDLFFRRVADRLETCEAGTFQSIWEEELEGYLKQSVLEEEGLLLREMGTQLGTLDLEEQGQSLERFLQRWREQIRRLEELEKTRGHLYRSFGICGGIFLVLILI